MMKGKSLIELATAVQEQAARKVDVVADTRNIEFKLETVEDKRVPTLLVKEGPPGALALAHAPTVSPHAVSQIAEYTGIPAKYAQRMMQDAPALMEANVNHWFKSEPSLRMIRTLTGPGDMRARAFLSNKYHRMENDQLLATVLPVLMDNNQLNILSTEITDTRMYLKVVFKQLEGEVKKGDVVQYGFTLSNSEIGMGAMSVTPFIYRLVCLNGLTLPANIDDARMRKAHLGRALEVGADYFTDETLKADDHALQLKLRDTLIAFQDTKRWGAVLTKLQATANTGPAINAIATVERIAETLALPQAEQQSVLMNFLRDGDLTKWGLVNAVTAVANDAESYDRACELEKFGGRVLDLPAKDWSVLAQAV